MDQVVEEHSLLQFTVYILIMLRMITSSAEARLKREVQGASLTGDEGYVKDTYSASLGAGENRWCYDSRASLQRLFSTNVHLGGQLAVTSASAC